MADADVIRRLISEAYKEVRLANRTIIPSSRKVLDHAKYNISAKAQDIVYGLSTMSITVEMVVDCLTFGNYMFHHEGFINDPQLEVFKKEDEQK